MASSPRVDSPSGVTPDDTWQAIEAEGAGLALRLPSDRTVFDLTDRDWDQLFEGFEESNPELGAAVRVALDVGAAISLYAFAPTDIHDPFPGILNVLRADSSGLGADFLRDATIAGLEGLDAASGVTGAAMPIAGLPGLHVVGRMLIVGPHGSDIPYCVHQGAAVGDETYWAISFSDDVPSPSLYEAIVSTLAVEG